MHLAAHLVAMDLSAESPLHPLHSSAENDPTAAASPGFDGETFRPQPGHSPIKAVMAHTEAVAELLWREPPVVVWRGGILLIFEPRSTSLA